MANTLNDEPKVDGANLTPEDAHSMISTKSGTVEGRPVVRVFDEEKADGVTSVEEAMVSPAILAGRKELLSRLTPDFQGAMVRLQHRTDGDTSLVCVETYHGNPIVDGKPVAFSDDPNDPYKSQSERHQDVFAFGTDGAFVGAYRQRINQDMSKPVNEVFTIISTDPIEEDGLVERVKTLVSDLHICVDGGK